MPELEQELVAIMADIRKATKRLEQLVIPGEQKASKVVGHFLKAGELWQKALASAWNGQNANKDAEAVDAFIDKMRSTAVDAFIDQAQSKQEEALNVDPNVATK